MYYRSGSFLDLGSIDGFVTVIVDFQRLQVRSYFVIPILSCALKAENQPSLLTYQLWKRLRLLPYFVCFEIFGLFHNILSDILLGLVPIFPQPVWQLSQDIFKREELLDEISLCVEEIGQRASGGTHQSHHLICGVNTHIGIFIEVVAHPAHGISFLLDKDLILPVFKLTDLSDVIYG